MIGWLDGGHRESDGPMGRQLGLGVLVATIVVSGWGCSGGGTGTTTGAGVGTTTSGASDTSSAGVASSGEVAIVQFGGGNGVNADFVALEKTVRADPDGLRVAALRHLADTDPMVHYAAVYALVRTAKSGESLKALKRLLVSDDVNDRLMAAAALVYRGDSTGIPVLIDELGAPDSMALRDPPETASGFASEVLLRFTREDFGLRSASDAAGAAAVKPAWRQWWNDHGAVLGWDPATEDFH